MKRTSTQVHILHALPRTPRPHTYYTSSSLSLAVSKCPQAHMDKEYAAMDEFHLPKSHRISQDFDSAETEVEVHNGLVSHCSRSHRVCVCMHVWYDGTALQHWTSVCAVLRAHIYTACTYLYCVHMWEALLHFTQRAQVKAKRSITCVLLSVDVFSRPEDRFE